MLTLFNARKVPLCFSTNIDNLFKAFLLSLAIYEGELAIYEGELAIYEGELAA